MIRRRKIRYFKRTFRLEMRAPNIHYTLLSLPYCIKVVHWIIHEKDNDIFPSCPHAHAVERNAWKMDLYTGKIYNKNTHKVVSSIKKKKLKSIWAYPGVYSIVLKERERYEELRAKDPIRYPPLPDIPKYLIPSEKNLSQGKDVVVIYSPVVHAGFGHQSVGAAA